MSNLKKQAEHRHLFNSEVGYGRDRSTVVLMCACGERVAFNRAHGTWTPEERPKIPVMMTAKVRESLIMLDDMNKVDWAYRIGTVLGILLTGAIIFGIYKAFELFTF
jgi:hypothetical protein